MYTYYGDCGEILFLYLGFIEERIYKKSFELFKRKYGFIEEDFTKFIKIKCKFRTFS